MKLIGYLYRIKIYLSRMIGLFWIFRKTFFVFLFCSLETRRLVRILTKITILIVFDKKNKQCKRIIYLSFIENVHYSIV